MSITDEQTEGNNSITPDNVPDTLHSQELVINEGGITPSVRASHKPEELGKGDKKGRCVKHDCVGKFVNISKKN